MKRDLDLARRLLLDIENHGTDCSVNVLRSAAESDRCETNDETIRHHLRLLIDADFLKEIDRTSSGIPCVRLTNEGHELLELARHEAHWDDAKAACQECTGGLSLRVIQNILLRWAIADFERLPHTRHPLAARRVRQEPVIRRQRLGYRVEPHQAIEGWDDRPWVEPPTDAVRYVPAKPPVEAYYERSPRYRVDLDRDGQIDVPYDSTLPTYLI